MTEYAHHIGGHFAAAICGKHPFIRPIDVYAQVLGLAESPAQTDEMRLGHVLEGGLLRLAADRLGKLRRVAPHAWVKWPLLRSAPDARVQAHDELVSAKVIGFHQKHGWGRPETDRVPAYVTIQETLYMGIDACERSHVVALIGGTPGFWEVPFSPRLFEVLVDRIHAFERDHLIPRRPPPDYGTEAFGDHLRREVKELRLEFRPATDAEVQLARRYRNATLAEKAAARAREALQQELKAAIGEDRGIETPDGPVRWATNATGARVLTIPRKWHESPAPLGEEE